jgi:flavoprotein
MSFVNPCTPQRPVDTYAPPRAPQKSKERQCRQCKEYRPISAFEPKNGDKMNKTCRNCLDENVPRAALKKTKAVMKNQKDDEFDESSETVRRPSAS